MQRATYRAPLIVFSAAFLVLLMVTAVRTAAAPKGKPLSEQEVLELLKGGVPSSQASKIVDDRGIGFDFTHAIEQNVRHAGGDDNVVAALRRASRSRAESGQQRTGALAIKTIPGETRIYLNDELKGTTSSAGELRLPDLKPGAYNLRISMPGYKTFEKPMTIAAGEEQTVRITLVQNPPTATPEDNRAPHQQPPVAIPSPGIPIPGIKTPTVQFYEGPPDVILEPSQRLYRYSFDRFTARSIYWEVDLTFPPPGRRIGFQLNAVWYKSDGSEMTRQPLSVFVLPEWGSSWHTLGYGYVEPGHWTPGNYRVDFYLKDVRIASGTFQIN